MSTYGSSEQRSRNSERRSRNAFAASLLKLYVSFSEALRLRLMTGGEIVAAGKAAEAVGKKLLAEDEKTRDVLLHIAESTPEMTAAAKSMAARVAVRERVKLKLYEPFARMLGVSKAYFEDSFPLEMGAKIADIPEENLVTPAASVAVPTLQGLSYTFEETSLKNLYLNLLATASDGRRAKQAHPGFAEIIKQLAPEEAMLLIDVLAMRNVPAVRIIDVNSTLNYDFDALIILASHLLHLSDKEGVPRVDSRIPTWADNWVRLGLVNVTYVTEKVDGFDWVMERPEFIEICEKSNSENVEFEAGLLTVSNFGQQFLRAIS